jgi:hypothetical protein
MVDATDFATPETGETVTAKYSKDGGGLSTCSNTVSEVTSGLYVITLAATETNADVVAYQMTGAASADQWLIFYPDGRTASISDILSTLDGPIDSAITQNTGLISDVLSTIDDNVASELTAIKSDITAVYSALSDFEATAGGDVTAIKSDITAVYSALSDAEATIVSDVTAVYSALSDFEKTVGDQVTSILADTVTLSNATYGLDALESLTSQILTDTGTTLPSAISNVRSGVTGVYSALSDFEKTTGDKVTSILTDTGTILDNKLDSILVDTGTTLDNKIDSVLADTITLSNATYGLDALETITSQIKSTIDNPVTDYLTSIVDDTSKIHSTLDAAAFGLDAIETITSQIKSTIDDPVTDYLSSILADTITLSNATYGLDALETITSDILAGLGTDSDKITSILADTVTLSNATYGLDALETICSDILSTLDDNVASELTAIKSDVTAVYSALSDFEATIVSDVTAVKGDTASTAAWGLINSGVVFRGIVSAADPGVSFTIGGLAGQGAGAFVDAATPWYAYVFRDGGGAGAAPQGETQTATGLFTTNAFTEDIAVGDDIIIMSGRIAAIPDIKAETALIKTDTTAIISDVTAVYSSLSDFEATIVSDVTAVKSSISDTLAMSTGNSDILSASISDLLSTIDGAGIKPVTAEPGAGAPGATIPTGEKIDYLYTVFRNKIETTSGTQKVYDDAGTTVLLSCALSDDGTTFTKAEHA